MLCNLADSSAFKTKIKVALANPDGKCAMQALNNIFPLLKLGGNNKIWSSEVISSSRSYIYTMTQQYYGQGFMFLTIAPDDVNNSTSFQLSIPKS
eukprot:3140978-Ditylum_brightwellii.AAC.1